MWSNVLGDLAGVGVDEHIAIGGRSRGEQIGLATSEITRYLMENPVRAVVVGEPADTQVKWPRMATP